MLENGQVVKISDTKMKIKIALPKDLNSFKNYEVVYILDNEIKETIPATLEDGHIVFETTHLSHYGIVATGIVNNIDNPNTGDSLVFYIAVSVLSVIGIIGLGLYRCKKLK